MPPKTVFISARSPALPTPTLAGSDRCKEELALAVCQVSTRSLILLSPSLPLRYAANLCEAVAYWRSGVSSHIGCTIEAVFDAITAGEASV